MKLNDQVALCEALAAVKEVGSVKLAIAELTVAVGYFGPDGTQKLCGDRCMFHIEDGKYKDRCTLLGKNTDVPDIASCTYYAKGQSADKWEKTLQPVIPVKIFTPEQVGLVIGKVQCKRCTRSAGDGTCKALTNVLQQVLGFKNAKFNIDPDGCCNWNKAPGQEQVKS